VQGREVYSEEKTVEHPPMSDCDVVACFIGAFLDIVIAALLIAVLG